MNLNSHALLFSTQILAVAISVGHVRGLHGHDLGSTLGDDLLLHCC